MATLMEKRAEAMKKLQSYQQRLKSDGVTLSDEETKTIKGLLSEVEGLDEQIDKASKDVELLRGISALSESGDRKSVV